MTADEIRTELERLQADAQAEVDAIRAEQTRYKRTFIARGELFAIGREKDLLTLYIEDDGLWHPTFGGFNKAWLPDLLAVVEKAARRVMS